jgi:hypothetical protein
LQLTLNRKKFTSTFLFIYTDVLDPVRMRVVGTDAEADVGCGQVEMAQCYKLVLGAVHVISEQ